MKLTMHEQNENFHKVIEMTKKLIKKKNIMSISYNLFQEIGEVETLPNSLPEGHC